MAVRPSWGGEMPAGGAEMATGRRDGLLDVARGAIGDALGRPGPRRVVRWITGTSLVGLGARVALDRT